MNFSVKTRLSLILFLAGFAGVVSILLIDLSALIALVPVSARSNVPAITPLIKILSLIQPTVLLLVAVLTGVALSQKVGLSAPVAESIATGGRLIPALKPQLGPGFLGGLVGALAILLTTAVLRPLLTTETVERISSFGQIAPIPLRLLYGGITEEVLLRWGLMTLVVWVTWRLFQKTRTRPTKICFVTAIMLSSIMFGIGHLPIAFLLFPRPSATLVLFVIIANSAFGFVAGYLYWKRGLESAIIAHMFCHVILITASYAGAYF